MGQRERGRKENIRERERRGERGMETTPDALILTPSRLCCFIFKWVPSWHFQLLSDSFNWKLLTGHQCPELRSMRQGWGVGNEATTRLPKNVQIINVITETTKCFQSNFVVLQVWQGLIGKQLTWPMHFFFRSQLCSLFTFLPFLI